MDITPEKLLLYCDEEARGMARFSFQQYAKGDLTRWCKPVREEMKREREEEKREVLLELSLEECIEWVAEKHFHLAFRCLFNQKILRTI